jgi:hypothetical protein
LLGKVSDKELAQRTGHSVGAVKAMRLKHTDVRLDRRNHSRPHQPPLEWTAEQKELLKTFHSSEVAARIGCSLKSVLQARREFGIRQARPARPWTALEDALLGTEPDAKLALRLHRGALSVRQRRLALSRPVISLRAPDWTKEEIKILGTVTDAEAARMLNRTVAAVRFRRNRLGIPAVFDDMDSRWWTTEAARLGRTKEAVKLHRTRRHIPAFDSRCRRWTAHGG